MLHINNENFRNQRICDLGGQEILGMGGSLRGYIETGNAYHKDYFQKNAEKSNKNEEKNDKSCLKKVLIAGGIITATALGIFALHKTGKMPAIKEAVSGAWTKIKDLFKKAPEAAETEKKGFFALLKEKGKNFIENVREAFKKPGGGEGTKEKGKIAKFFSGIVEKIKGAFKKAPEPSGAPPAPPAP